MANITVHTKGRPCSVGLKLKVSNECTLRVIAFNPKMPRVVFYDREFTGKGDEKMDIKLPISSPTVDIKVICDNGAKVEISKVKKSLLTQYTPCYSKHIEFIRFAESICKIFPYIPNGVYKSEKGKYTIEIYENIPDSGTPARIHNSTGVIELSKSKMSSNTVAMNMAILLHEYSHFYVNHTLEDEIEADVNALKIYLGRGYPFVESHKAFTEVFSHSDVPLNRERYEYISAMVANFNKLKHRSCL
jgi:hypothetical protein